MTCPSRHTSEVEFQAQHRLSSGNSEKIRYNWTGLRNWKLSGVSAGMRTFFLPVKAAPAVPAPAPAPAPISAPVGPPAKAPIAAPPAAPPPMASRLRFLCDPLVRAACDVEMLYFLPLSSNASRLRLIPARPFSLPEGADVLMRPEKLAPFGMTVFPSTLTGESSVALKRSPERLRWVSRVSESRTRSKVPCGTVIGVRSTGGSGFAVTAA